MEGDSAGTLYGGSHFYLTPRDLAKFGLLQLRKGLWEGRQIYSPEWYQYITTPAPTWMTSNSSGKVHSAHWWPNKDFPHRKRPYPAVPQDALISHGHWGQSLSIIPSLKLILVRNGWDLSQTIDLNKMLELLIESLQ